MFFLNKYFQFSSRDNKSHTRLLTLFFCITFIYNNFYLVNSAIAISYTWSGAINNQWNNANNWTPSGIPGSADDVTVGNTVNQAFLASATTLTSLTVNLGGTVNLNQKLLTVTGNFMINIGGCVDINNDTLTLLGTSTFNGGRILNSGPGGYVNVLGATTNFGSALGSPVINPTINVLSATLTIWNTFFNGTTVLEKNGGGNDISPGNNTFNGNTTIKNSSSSGYMILSNNNRDTYNSIVTFVNSQSNIIYVAFSDIGTQFNDNVILSNTGTGSIRFGQNLGTSILKTGKTISIGTWSSSGSLYLMNFTQTGSTAQSIILNGTGTIYLQSGTVFNGDLNVTSPQLYLNGSTYNGNTVLEKKGAVNNDCLGGNVFGKKATIINSGSGYLKCSSATADLYSDDATFTNTGSNLIYVAYNDATGTSFNGNVFVNSTSGTGIQFGSATGTAILKTGKTISAGGLGFTTGTLLLRNFTQQGTTTQNIALSGSAWLTIGPGSAFNADLTTSSPSLILNGCAYNGKATFVKSGALNDVSTGGNTFNRDLTVTVTGAGYLQFNGASNDFYNGNVVVNSTGGGIRFGQNAGTCSLAANKTITVGATGFSSGVLSLRSFTQFGTLAQSLTLTGTAALYLETGTTFNGDVNFITPQLYLNGAQFIGLTTLEKNGATNNLGNGGNTFKKTASITNSGSGYLLTANVTRDLFNDNVTFTNTGSSYISIAFNDAVGTQFDGNIIVNSTSGTGIQFGSNAGTCTLSATKTISVGGLGFSAGTLLLKNFTQNGATAQTLNLSGNAGITIGPTSIFAGSLTTVSPALQLNSSTFNGITSFTKTGSTNDLCLGGNLFNAASSIINNGTGSLTLANTAKDVFNNDVTFTNTNTGIIYPAYNDAHPTLFNGNIILNNTSTGGIRFGQNTGVAILANTKTISIGSSGFATGDLYLRNFTQTGGTYQSMVLSSSTSSLYLQTGTVFNANLNFTFPQVYLNGSTFNGVTVIEKNGAGSNLSTGGNTFNGVTTLINSGSGAFQLANTTGDVFNNDATFDQLGSGALSPAYNNNNTFSKAVSTLSSLTAITFGSGTGIVTLIGTAIQSINGNAGTAPTFNRLFVNNGVNGVTLNVTVNVNNNLTLTSGNIFSNATNLLIIANAATVSGASNASYVSGYVRKVGNQAFTFPLGANGSFRPIGISAPGLSTDHFTATYINVDPNSSYNVNSRDATIDHLSRCEYWILNRTNGSTDVNVTLSWNNVSCGVTLLSALRVSRWDVPTTKWKDLGNGGTTGNTTSGTVNSSIPATAYGAFTLASNSNANPLPIELAEFNVKKTDGDAEILWKTLSEVNNDYFTIERSVDGENYEEISTIRGAGNSNTVHYYSMLDTKPLPGLSFYRLRQNDYNGNIHICDPKKFHNYEEGYLTVGPNPFSNFIRINFFTSVKDKVNIELRNLEGIAVYSGVLTFTGENSFADIDVSKINSGIYFLVINESNNNSQIRKVVKL